VLLVAMGGLCCPVYEVTSPVYEVALYEVALYEVALCMRLPALFLRWPAGFNIASMAATRCLLLGERREVAFRCF
jgi:hypothetical protein